MNYNKHDIKLETINLCLRQRAFLNNFPKRENIPVYDVDLDLEYNEDFAIWAMEMKDV